MGNNKIVKKAISLTLAAATSVATYILIRNIKTNVVVGIIVSEATTDMIDYFYGEVGEFMYLTTVGEVYNAQTGLYESIVTTDKYKKGDYNDESRYYRCSLKTVVDQQKYETSIFDNTIY